MNNRERLGSRLGFILLSAGCAIGCGNVWKFPWMAGQYGGGGFVLIYVLCLVLLGLPVMTMEFSLGRAAQASPVKMYQKLQKPGQKWHIHGYLALFGNICLMSFYTVVAGWILYYFYSFVTGQTADLGFVNMITNPGVNVTFMLVAVVLGYIVLCFNLQGGLERVTKYMMVALLGLMIVLAVNSCLLDGSAEGLSFYLKPNPEAISPHVRSDLLLAHGIHVVAEVLIVSLLGDASVGMKLLNLYYHIYIFVIVFLNIQTPTGALCSPSRDAQHLCGWRRCASPCCWCIARATRHAAYALSCRLLSL